MVSLLVTIHILWARSVVQSSCCFLGEVKAKKGSILNTAEVQPDCQCLVPIFQAMLMTGSLQLNTDVVDKNIDGPGQLAALLDFLHSWHNIAEVSSS